MQASLGRITAHLAENDTQITLELVNLLNQNIKPPTPLTEQDIYIRAMYLVSDEVNSYGGRFPSDGHPHLASLLIDSPVLIGHRKDTLPIARNFHAVCLDREGSPWVKSYFYWLKASEGAETLRENIDGGIYKECSIGFTYLMPECSICGKDIRSCSHIPMQPCVSNGEEQICHFNYRQIERVLETSLVYRGATPDTSISKELIITKLSSDTDTPPHTFLPLADLASLPPHPLHLVTPHYEGLDCRLSFSDNRWALARLSGETVNFDLPKNVTFAENDTTPRLARLVGYKGRERCGLPQLEKFLAGERSVVTRLMLWIIPNCEEDHLVNEDRNGTVRMIRHCLAALEQLPEVCKSLATKDGVDIRAVEDSVISSTIYYLQLATPAGSATYTLRPLHGSSSWLLELLVNGRSQRYLLRQFDLHRLKQGARFIADKAALHMSNLAIDDAGASGTITSIRAVDEGCLIDFDGSLHTTIAVRPVKLDGRNRYLIYCPERITAQRSRRLSGLAPGR